AGYFYAGLREGSAALRQPIRQLAEQLDSVSLFGRELDRLQPGALSRLVSQLRVSTGVALDEDIPRLSVLTADPAWAPPMHVGPLLLLPASHPRAPPPAVGPP